MKKYTHCLQNEKVVFNNVLRASKTQIECGFGRRKARWSMLTKQIDLKLENIPYIIHAYFVLHNFCDISNIETNEKFVLEYTKHIHNNDQVPQYHQENIFECNNEEGQFIRNIISNYIKTCLPGYLIL